MENLREGLFFLESQLSFSRERTEGKPEHEEQETQGALLTAVKSEKETTPRARQEAVLIAGAAPGPWCPLQPPGVPCSPPALGTLPYCPHRSHTNNQSSRTASTRRNHARVSKNPDFIPGEASRRGIPVPRLLLFCFYARVT